MTDNTATRVAKLGTAESSENTLSALSVASQQFAEEAKAIADKLRQRADEPKSLHPTASVESYTSFSNQLAGCIFVGHTNTDMDSIGSALASAVLYGGVPARSAGGGDVPREVNGEIMHALAFAGLELPPFFQDIPGAMDSDGPPVCFVDTNHPTQMVAPMPSQLARIRGCIDHHNLVLQTPTPIFMDVRPWGSCCSIIAHNYMRMGTPMPQPIAKILLCGILSDTINLVSPTTTDADRVMMAMLARLAEVDAELDTIAQKQFKAKTASFAALSPFAMVRADMKCFQAKSGTRFAWATIEVLETTEIYAKAPQIIGELRLLKEAKEKEYRAANTDHPTLSYAFLSVVDITEQTSQVLLCGGREVALAKMAFKGTLSRAPGMNGRLFAELAASKHLRPELTMMNLGSRVSRKLEFVPPVMAALDSGTVDQVSGLPHEMVAKIMALDVSDELVPLVFEEHDGTCADGSCLNRTLSSPREESRGLLGVIEGQSLPTLGLVTRDQREAAKANPPPPNTPPAAE